MKHKGNPNQTQIKPQLKSLTKMQTEPNQNKTEIRLQRSKSDRAKIEIFSGLSADSKTRLYCRRTRI